MSAQTAKLIIEVPDGMQHDPHALAFLHRSLIRMGIEPVSLKWDATRGVERAEPLSLEWFIQQASSYFDSEEQPNMEAPAARERFARHLWGNQPGFYRVPDQEREKEEQL